MYNFVYYFSIKSVFPFEKLLTFTKSDAII